MLLAAKSEAASIPDAATQSAPTYDASVDAPASAQAAEIAHPRRIRGPCTDCRLSVPGLREPRPLLVLLHGDNETAESIFGAWAPIAEARGVSVLALACPRARGCTMGSWWQWNGDPGYLLEQVEAAAAYQPVDRQRMWIAGWSGGASYIGYRTQEIERSFAAIVVHGGGIPPALVACARPSASVYFLVGDHNPLHALAVQLRDHYARCEGDVTWALLPGADHAAEWRALASHEGAILDWLAGKQRG